MKNHTVFIGKKNIHFALPVIVLSTITGTANFAQESFPEKYKHFLIMAIGTLNLIAGLITTISQFLRINELQEGYRVAEVGFSKLNRNIEVILDLPIKYRNVSGETFLESCRQEYDRLIEQSPMIPKNIVLIFHKKFRKNKFSKPNLINIEPIEIYQEQKTLDSELTEEEKIHQNTMRSLRFLKEQMNCMEESNEEILTPQNNYEEICSPEHIDIIVNDTNENNTSSDENKSNTSSDENKSNTSSDENKSNTSSDENKSNTSSDENNI